MSKIKSPQWPENLSTHERIAQAQDIIDKLIDHVQEIIALHESNRILVYSGKLSDQIPSSFAAHTFNALQRSQHLYEIVRLLALWDKPSKDRYSIPTVIALLDSDDVCQALIKKTRELWPAEVHFGDERAELTRKRLMVAKRIVSKVEMSEHHPALRRFRDDHVAHNLNLVRTPPKPHRLPKSGDERWLLKRSLWVVECLNRSIDDSSFDWDGSIKISCKNAVAFWHGVTIKVLR
jgi:hypothetical protein